MRGAVTCKQAYELVVQLLASDPQPVLPSGVLPADLVRPRQQPRPCSRSTSRQRSPKRRPTTGAASGPCLRLLSGLFPSPRMPRSPLALRIMLVDLFSHHTMKWHGPVTPYGLTDQRALVGALLAVAHSVWT